MPSLCIDISGTGGKVEIGRPMSDEGVASVGAAIGDVEVSGEIVLPFNVLICDEIRNVDDAKLWFRS